MNCYTELYYENVVGSYPDSEEYVENTNKVIEYLQDAGISNEEILQFVEEAPSANCLTPEMLPDWLWENSLLTKDVFYYHRTLQIISNAPSFNSATGIETVYPFYMEMKIRYTMEDLVRYFYRKIGLDFTFMEIKRDSAAFGYLLERYRKIVKFIEPLDYVLSLIDYAKSMNDEQNMISKIFDIQMYELEVQKMLTSRTAEAEHAKMNRVVWR